MTISTNRSVRVGTRFRLTYAEGYIDGPNPVDVKVIETTDDSFDVRDDQGNVWSVMQAEIDNERLLKVEAIVGLRRCGDEVRHHPHLFLSGRHAEGEMICDGGSDLEDAYEAAELQDMLYERGAYAE